MPSLTYDGRSFMIDGRRIWLVAGSIQYARVPKQYWSARIHAAKVAGLNTVETPVFWNRHESRPGHFDFSGDNDLRHFIQLIGQAGMYCILRPGPFVGLEWDSGGLPAWLLSVPGIKLRTASGPFLEACSRYLTAVAEQVRDLQATSPGKGGPIVLVQNESAWTCGDEVLARSYLGELNRYLREAGLNVPTINANNLWQSAEGEIDSWNGSADTIATVRQLASVRPDQPRLIIECDVGAPGAWGRQLPPALEPAAVQQRLAGVLAAGGQFNIHPFHGGTSFGFWGGRLADGPDAFATASRDHGAPLTEAGRPGPLFHAVRTVCTFASRFGRVFANLEPAYHPVAVDPASLAQTKRAGASPVSVAHATGPHGGVAFLFSDGKVQEPVPLLLPDGTRLPVEIGGMPVAWCVFGASLGGRAHLDYCNLSALGFAGKAFVVFGPQGAHGRLSINGSPLEVTVPSGRDPLIVTHEGITTVVCSAEQVEHVHIGDDAVFVGAAGIAQDGRPIGLGSARNCTRIDGAGATSTVPVVPGPRRPTTRPEIGEWACAPAADYAKGSSPRFASIDGPADLTALGSPYGLGWYRVRFKSSGARRALLAFPHAADRLHVHLDGEFQGVVGAGPGAMRHLTGAIKKGPNTLVVLAENLGRVCGGADLGERKGLFGHVWEVKPVRTGRPSLVRSDPVDPLAFRSPLWEVHAGDLTLPERLTWTFSRKPKAPLVMTLDGFTGRALVMLNNKPVRYIDQSSTDRVVFEAEQFGRGTTTVQLAVLAEPGGPGDPQHLAARTQVSFFESVANLSAKAEWAFARWEAPRASAFSAGARPEPRRGPAWWKASFEGADADAPLFFDATGLTKGQLYVNGHHVGRYFVATAGGKAVPPQSLYYIPSPWLRTGKPNELLVFDEHGASPARCRLVHEA